MTFPQGSLNNHWIWSPICFTTPLSASQAITTSISSYSLPGPTVSTASAQSSTAIQSTSPPHRDYPSPKEAPFPEAPSPSSSRSTVFCAPLTCANSKLSEFDYHPRHWHRNWPLHPYWYSRRVFYWIASLRRDWSHEEYSSSNVQECRSWPCSAIEDDFLNLHDLSFAVSTEICMNLDALFNYYFILK